MKRLKTYKLKDIYKALVLLGVLAFVVLMPSCKPEKDTYTTDYGYAYYPIDSGHYVAYQVDSIRFLNADERDTASYHIMEMVGDTFYDNENELCRRIHVYRRQSGNAQWQLDRIWHLKQTTTNLQKVEDDVRFIKLIFPQAEEQVWNGNQYIPETEPFKVFKNWEYTYTNVHQPAMVNGLSFDSTLTVVEIDTKNSNVIEQIVSTAVYAKGVGMIQCEKRVLGKEATQNPDWEAASNSGFILRMKVIDHN